MRLAITCLLLALALPAAAEIYKYTDAKGNTVYTNQPPEGQAVETVELPPTNTVDMPKPAAPLGGPALEAEQQTAYRVLELTGIPDDGAMRANNGTFGVGVKLEPSLQPGHRLRLLLDGRPYGQASSMPQLQLSNVERGEHSLAVEVLRGEQSIQQSATHSFTVQRVNTSSPALRPPPPPKPVP